MSGIFLPDADMALAAMAAFSTALPVVDKTQTVLSARFENLGELKYIYKPVKSSPIESVFNIIP
jgi:hypothetical protein